MFSDIIKSLRAQKGISQTQLAKEIGVSPGNIGDWEIGRSKPGYLALSAIARFFEVSADYLLELEIPTVKTGDELSQYKSEQGLTCDGSPLQDDEADLIAMFRLLPDYQQEDIFDLVYLKYKKHVERKKASIYSTYTRSRGGESQSGPGRGDEAADGTA